MGENVKEDGKDGRDVYMCDESEESKPDLKIMMRQGKVVNRQIKS